MKTSLATRVCALGALTVAANESVLCQVADTDVLAEKIVMLDIALLACSKRLKVEGFRFNRVQGEWRDAIASNGIAAQSDYKRRHASEMIEVLRIMSNDDRRACTHAYARVNELFGPDSPLVGLEPLP